MNEAATFKPWEKWIGALLLALFVLAAVLSIIMPERFRPHEPEPQAVQPEVRNIGPAPTVRKGPRAILRGELVSTWIVEDAGDASYLGTYAASGSYGGEICYTNGSRWLFVRPGGLWTLHDALDDSPFPDHAYTSESATLPGNPWTAGLAGTAPAPTVSEYISTEPTTGWPFTYSGWWARPTAPPSTPPFAPCTATLGGTAYIVLPDPAGKFCLYDPVGDAWTESDLGAAFFSAGQYDPTQGGGVFDAGDGTHLWMNSGIENSLYLRWRKYAVTPGGAASLVSSSNVDVNSTRVTNCVQVAAGVYRFVKQEVSRFVLCQYTAGDAAFVAVNDFDPVSTGYIDVTTRTIGALGESYDWHLLSHDGDLYMMRHMESDSGEEVHRIFPYIVTDSALTALDSFTIADTDYFQTWAYYPEASQIVGDIGSGGTALAQVDPAGAYWTPATGGSIGRGPFCPTHATRRWYVPGDPLRLAGWAVDTEGDLKPFVLQPELLAVSSSAASSFAAGRRVAGAHTSSYAIDEGVLTHVSAEAVTGFAAGLQVAAAGATAHAAGLAVTGAAASSHAAGLAPPSTEPHPIIVNVGGVRARAI